ncbi:hypothetical protein [Nocardioides nanhaiensis]|uniref:Lipoprotein n=1 Tax=Nocardioides nanhaiensis TaxID=1476871 RepID=A0ABP8VXH3_9ACTN
MRRALALGLAAVLLGGCGGGSDEPTRSASTPDAGPTQVRTLVPLPAPPEEPPSGRLHADMRQSSIDAALGQMQVWLDNDRVAGLDPSAVTYRDPRLPRPVGGQRLRPLPADTELGYPLTLPARPVCDSSAAAESGVLLVRSAQGTRRVPVTDPTDVVGRYLAQRCQELAVAEVAQLRWADDAEGTLTLQVRPTGRRPDATLVIDAVAGSHLLGYGDDPAAWEPALVVRGDDPPTTLPLPLTPTRCDGHAFAEGGGATAFRVSYTLDDTPGRILLRMTPAGAASVLDWAAGVCGLE